MYADRRDALRERLGEVPAALVVDLPDVRYLSGFSGSNGALLVTPDTAILATDGRYEQQAAAECPGVEFVITRRLVGDLLDAARSRGIGSVGFDPGTMDVRLWEAGQDLLVPVDLSDLRLVKDPAELDAVREACDISVRALAALLEEIRVGMTEVEIARLLELAMGREGGEDRAFPTIVATGENSAIPHHHPTPRPIAEGDLLKIDFGATYAGYHADCTRTFVVGAEPQSWQLEVHAIVAAAQQAGIAALGPGVSGKDVDTAARTVIEQAGYGQFFGHGLGHGVGLVIHEAPFLGQHSANTVEAEVPLTVEPGIYLPGRGGVRIEDTLVVHADGSEILTRFPRDLVRVG